MHSTCGHRNVRGVTRRGFRFLPGFGLAALLAVGGLSRAAPLAAASPRAPFSAEELIRAVARAQRRADLAVTASTDTYAAELARLLYHGLAPPAGPHRQDTP